MRYRLHQIADYNGNPCNYFIGSKAYFDTLNEAYQDLQRIMDFYKNNPEYKWDIRVEELE